MAKQTSSSKPANSGKDWSAQDIAQLRREARQDIDTDQIAKDLQRSVPAIYSEASKLNISLDPPDKR